ncbi:ATP-binding cassette domain-containing protein [Actinomadura luteofluorescens]
MDRAEVPVVHEVTLDAAPGAVTVILGANGAGKTTLMDGIAGLAPVRSGTIRLDGKAIERLAPYKRARAGLGYVEQARTTFRTLTVEQNLVVSQQGDGDLGTVYRLFPELEKRRTLQAGYLSGGEQQMVVLGRALVSAPKVVLIDEMSLGLAPLVVRRADGHGRRAGRDGHRGRADRAVREPGAGRRLPRPRAAQGTRGLLRAVRRAARRRTAPAPALLRRAAGERRRGGRRRGGRERAPMNLVDKRGLGTGLGIAVLACALLPLVLPPYWIYLAISAVISAVIMQSFGVIVGRAGVMSLCQMSFAAIGAWVMLRLNVADAPGGFYLWLLLGGLAAVPVGVAIGLPALRIRGVNLAVVTFGFAVSTDIVLNVNPFPGSADLTMLERPAPFDTDGGYFVFTVIVFTVLAVVLGIVGRTRLGLSWYELRHSERSAAAHGVSVARSKLAAFAISAFVAGIGGGLLVGQLSLVVPQNFAMGQSLALFAVAIMIGPHHPEGAVLGGIFGAVMATIMEKISLPQDFGGVLFGAGALLALRSGLSQTDLTRMRKRERDARKILKAAEDAPAADVDEPPLPALAPRAAGDGAPVLAVQGLTVRFGEVVALDAVDLTVPEGAVVGLIGPNGAGKSTFIAAVSGFVAGYGGTVELAGRRLDGLGPSRRAALGLRRTFQTTAIAPELSLYDYLTIGSGRLAAAPGGRRAAGVLRLPARAGPGVHRRRRHPAPPGRRRRDRGPAEGRPAGRARRRPVRRRVTAPRQAPGGRARAVRGVGPARRARHGARPGHLRAGHRPGLRPCHRLRSHRPGPGGPRRPGRLPRRRRRPGVLTVPSPPPTLPAKQGPQR